MENPAVIFLFDLAAVQMDQLNMSTKRPGGAFLLVRQGLMRDGV